MKTYRNLYERLSSWENLNLAFYKAQLRKSNSPAIQEFSKNRVMGLAFLLKELRKRTYRPQPLKKFILRDPKTRTICVSHFRDRIVHHALINVLQPIFEPRFIHDSYASRKGKGTLPAIRRFDRFVRQLTHNGKRTLVLENGRRVIRGYVFKADIYHYFERVDHHALLNILKRRIEDDDVLWLVKVILDNYESKELGKGMPLGNWTSQFFANVYLNELDQFVKHELQAEYYIRYVDDFVILHPSEHVLREYETKIRQFLAGIKLDLHPTKCSISPLHRGTAFLGYRLFYHHKLLRKRNIYKIQKTLAGLLDDYGCGGIDAERVFNSLRGWSAYALHANTYRFREQLRRTTTAELLARNKNRDRARTAIAPADPPLTSSRF